MTLDLEAKMLLRLKSRVELARNLMESAQDMAQASLDQLKAAHKHLEQARQNKQQVSQDSAAVREQCRKALDLKRQELSRLRAASSKADNKRRTLAPIVAQHANPEVQASYNQYVDEVVEYEIEGYELNQEIGRIRQQSRKAERTFKLAESDYLTAKQELAHADSVNQAAQKLAVKVTADYDKVYNQLQDHLDNQ